MSTLDRLRADMEKTRCTECGESIELLPCGRQHYELAQRILAQTTILGCGHLSMNEDAETGLCMHADCVSNRDERAQQRMFENYYGGDTPQNDRERSDVASRQR